MVCKSRNGFCRKILNVRVDDWLRREFQAAVRDYAGQHAFGTLRSRSRHFRVTSTKIKSLRLLATKRTALRISADLSRPVCRLDSSTSRKFIPPSTAGTVLFMKGGARKALICMPTQPLKPHGNPADHFLSCHFPHQLWKPGTAVSSKRCQPVGSGARQESNFYLFST
jgi:hypothetical protein